ncbi:DUF3052 family protein [Cognatilysobacter terrigena]|uniref:DUF3052 family protein n=1 Tax=Cognatilysobacter terrigena TaxID=2488749 RepID=UPI001061E69D|nr:DUF3052 family protein [Lysobacter terrigena]
MATAAGYSGKPLAAKLGYAPSIRVLLIDAPVDYQSLLGDMPSGVTFVAKPGAGVRIAHVFSTSLSDLASRLADLASQLPADTPIWVSWPKKASKVPTDITEDRIRDVALPLGLVDVKVCAVDAVWSALKLVRRKALR